MKGILFNCNINQTNMKGYTMKFQVNFDIKALKKQGFTDKQIQEIIGSVESVESVSSRITSGLFGIVSKNEQVAEVIKAKGKTVKKLNVNKAVKLSKESQATFQPVLSLLQSQNLAYNLKNADKGLFNVNHLEFTKEYQKVVNERCNAHIKQCELESKAK